MKICLNCQKEFEYKREAAKFCSDKCRVMYNRKNPTNGVSLVQFKVLYNEVLNLVSQIKTVPLQTQQETLRPAKTISVEISPVQEKGNGLSYDELLRLLYAADRIEELEKVGRLIEVSDLLWAEKKKLHDIGKQLATEKFTI